MKKWETLYKGHKIRVENTVTHERLFVDNELQDEVFGIGFRSRLYGEIKGTDGSKEQIKVSLGGWFVQCRIFIDCHLVFHSKPDKIARNELSKIK